MGRLNRVSDEKEDRWQTPLWGRFGQQGSGYRVYQPAGLDRVVYAGDLGKGGFLVFGDDAIFQNKFLDANNKALADILR